jgi:hypothetical protein
VVLKKMLLLSIRKKYKGTASMRFDVPVGDPGGSYAGAIFPDATGRNLTGYDALTFWVKRLKQLL